MRRPGVIALVDGGLAVVVGEHGPTYKVGLIPEEGRIDGPLVGFVLEDFRDVPCEKVDFAGCTPCFWEPSVPLSATEEE